MSTLAEIEAAVDRLSHPEQAILLERLARKLGTHPPVTAGTRTQRERCLETSVLPVDSPCRDRSLQEILDNIRAED
jgi:hypothetical protein